MPFLVHADHDLLQEGRLALQSSNLMPLPPDVSIAPPRYEPLFFLFFSFVKPLPLVTIKSAWARSA